MPQGSESDYETRINALQNEIGELRDKVLPSLYEIRNMLLSPPEPRRADVEKLAPRAKKSRN